MPEALIDRGSIAERALRIIGVGHRRPEEGKDGVPHVLLDGAAMIGDGRAHLRERVTEKALHALGAEPDRRVGRTDDIDEQAGDEATFAPKVHAPAL
jgi:hypothetical protein